MHALPEALPDRRPSRARRGVAASLAAFAACEGRMPVVAATILRTNIHDLRFWMFCLGLQGGNKRVFGLRDDVVYLPLVLEPDGEVHRRNSSVRTSEPRSL